MQADDADLDSPDDGENRLVGFLDGDEANADVQLARWRVEAAADQRRAVRDEMLLLHAEATMDLTILAVATSEDRVTIETRSGDRLIGRISRVGADVALGCTIDDPYMVSIGAGAVLGNASLVSGNMVYGGKFVCGAVNIGAGATIGVNSVILPGTEVGANVTLLGGSYVMPGTKIPAGETWRGNPARKWM